MRICQRGHELKPENTYVYPNGKRTCKTCKQAYDREYYQQNLEKLKAYDREYRQRNLEKLKAGSTIRIAGDRPPLPPPASWPASTSP